MSLGRKNSLLLFVTILLALSPNFIMQIVTKKSVTKNYVELNVIKYPPVFSFAGEKIPLHDTLLNKHFFNELLANKYMHSDKIYLHSRAEKYFPTIEKILTTHGIPIDFKYVPLVESNFVDTAMSKKGAKGFWQLMPVMAAEFNLIVTDSIDERADLKKSTIAVCRYLKQSHKKFNSWIKALASLNYGIDGLQNVLDKQQLKTKVISTETNTYLFRLLVYKESFEHPEFYGINK